MKFVAILSLALALSVADAQDCPAYVCDPKGVTWPSKVCGMNDPTTPTTQYDIKSGYCSSSEICLYSPIVSPSTCVEIPKPTATQVAYPGEPCDDLNTCFTGTCTNSLCPTLQKGAACTHTSDCGGSLTCASPNAANPGTCQPVIAPGQTGCAVDSDCQQNAGCIVVGATGTCVQYMSIAPQQAVLSCGSATTALAPSVYCQSGYCFTTADGKSTLCSDAVKNTGTTSAACTGAGATCQSTADTSAKTTLTETCQCGYDGKYYCPQFPGDQYMAAFLADQATYLGSPEVKTCNSIRNTSANPPYYSRNYCDQAASKPSKSQLYSYYMAFSYAQWVNADKCALKNLQPGFYSYEDAANWMVLSGLVLALIY